MFCFTKACAIIFRARFLPWNAFAVFYARVGPFSVKNVEKGKIPSIFLSNFIWQLSFAFFSKVC